MGWNLWHTDGMKTPSSSSLFKGFRFPPEIISHCVWLYFRFSLSFRDIEELMAQRGIVLSYETVLSELKLHVVQRSRFW